LNKISVIVPAYNAEKTLKACLDAIRAQDIAADRFETIVVDNNSSDATRDIAGSFPRVRLLRERRQSSYAARNRGLSIARGDLIAFTDADCTPRSNWLDQLARQMADKNTMVVMGRDKSAGQTTAIRLLSDYDHRKEAYVMSSDNPDIYYGHTNNMMTRRETFEECGYFAELVRGGDVVFVHRVLSRYGTEAVKYHPESIVDHLEIRSAATYFKKAFVYGRSARRYAGIVPARPLSYRERMEVFHDTVESRGLSLRTSVYLFGLLAIGVASYELGQFSLPGSGWARPVDSPTLREEKP
jgi:glycosyltransferase involved in cell wall biosynthesis